MSKSGTQKLAIKLYDLPLDVEAVWGIESDSTLDSTHTPKQLRSVGVFLIGKVVEFDYR
jgi:hypothetical protein